MLPILTLLWPFLETAVKKNKHLLGEYPEKNDNKIQRNVLTALNAMGTILFGGLYMKYKTKETFIMAVLFPIIFYMYDAYYIWFHKVKDHYPMLFHHGAAIYFLQCIYAYEGKIKDVMILATIGLEFSNLPLQYVYHFLKSNEVKDIRYYKKLLSLKRIQLIVYALIRVLMYGYIVLYYTKDINHQPVLLSSLILLFCMGIYWFQHQVKGYFKTKKELKALQEQEKEKEEIESIKKK